MVQKSHYEVNKTFQCSETCGTGRIITIMQYCMIVIVIILI